MSKNKKNKRVNTDSIKKYLILGFVVVGVLFVGVSWFFMSSGDDVEDQQDESSKPEELVVEDDRNKLINELEGDDEEDSDEEDEGDPDEASRGRARDNLEKTDETLDDKEDIDDEELEKLNKDLVSLFELYKKDHDWDGNYYASQEFSNTIAGETSVDMSQQLDTAMDLLSYELDLDSAEWYESDSKDVYQFLVSVTHEDDYYDDLVFSGNYNKDKRVFNVFKMHGNLDVSRFAS